MSNMTVILIYLPISILTALTFFYAVFMEEKKPIVKYFVGICSSVFCWQLCDIAFYAARNPDFAAYVFNLRLPFIAVCAFMLLLFTMRFYRMEQYITPRLICLLSIIPVLTAIFALTSTKHTFIREHFTISVEGISMIAENIRGPWFWVHTVYCYIIILISLLLVVYFHRTLPKAYRLSSNFLTFGILMTAFSNILVLRVAKIPFDITAVSMCIALMFLYVAINSRKRMDFLLLARNEIFNYLPSYIFVLDTEQTILDYNLSAKEWLETQNFNIDNLSFYSLIEYFRGKGADIRISKEEDNEIDIYLSDPHQVKIYNLRDRMIFNKNGDALGTVITCADVTRNRLLIKQLEETAGIDALTGLFNRNRYELDKYMLDAKKNLPLALVLGDLNELKSVNDNLGHKQGDMLIQTAAKVLAENCPENGALYRIGGDEFIFFYPNCSENGITSLIDRINQSMAAITAYPFTVSMALGYAIKYNSGESLDSLFKKADENMYQNKKRQKQPH